MSDTNKNETVRELGEEELVGRLVAGLSSAPGLVTGPGDDCAVLESQSTVSELLLFKTDSVVEGIHFEVQTDPELAGRKALCRTISDIAAMGGRPTYALVTLAVDNEREVKEVEGWYRGIEAAAGEFGCVIAGGETTRLPNRGALLSIAMLGTVDRDHCMTRSGGNVGDWIGVTGRLGGSLSSGRHLSFSPRIEEGIWLAHSGVVTAMMDLSDGLGSDLPRLATSSGTGYALDLECLPCHDEVPVERAITDGEDYELLIAVSPDGWEGLEESWRMKFPDCELTKIGKLSEATDSTLPRRVGTLSEREMKISPALCSESEMIAFGREFSKRLRSGDVVALNGELGSGKTHFCKGVVAGLGSTARVTSPTFSLVQEYRGGKWPVFHFDFYRLDSPSELDSIGWDEYLEEEGILLVEWAEKFPEVLPEEAIQLRFERLEDESRRVHEL